MKTVLSYFENLTRDDLIDAIAKQGFTDPAKAGRAWGAVEYENFIDLRRGYREWTTGQYQGPLPTCGIKDPYDGDILSRWYEDELDVAAGHEWERLWVR